MDGFFKRLGRFLPIYLRQLRFFLLDRREKEWRNWLTGCAEYIS